MKKTTKDYPTDQVAVLHSWIRALLHDDRTGALTLRQVQILLLTKLGPRSGCTIRGLSEALPAPKPSITRSVDTLCELKLAEREPDPLDRRSIFVALTDEGDRLIRDLERALARAA